MEMKNGNYYDLNIIAETKAYVRVYAIVCKRKGIFYHRVIKHDWRLN